MILFTTTLPKVSLGCGPEDLDGVCGDKSFR